MLILEPGLRNRVINCNRWADLIGSLPPGLTLAAAARKLGLKYATVRHWILKCNYAYRDGRAGPWSKARRMPRTIMDPDKVDWTQSNIIIARRFKISRERVRQVRNRLATWLATL
jgi:hypothetical protein